MSVEFEVLDQDALPGMEEDGAENGNVDFEVDPAETMPVKEGRIIRKAKRPSKQLPVATDPSSNGVTSPVANGNKALLLNSKNSRRPRNLKGRGLPKKGEQTSLLFHPNYNKFQYQCNSI